MKYVSVLEGSEKKKPPKYNKIKDVSKTTYFHFEWKSFKKKLPVNLDSF